MFLDVHPDIIDLDCGDIYIPTYNLRPPYEHTFSAQMVVHTAIVSPLILLENLSFHTTLTHKTPRSDC